MPTAAAATASERGRDGRQDTGGERRKGRGQERWRGSTRDRERRVRGGSKAASVRINFQLVVPEWPLAADNTRAHTHIHTHTHKQKKSNATAARGRVTQEEVEEKERGGWRAVGGGGGGGGGEAATECRGEQRTLEDGVLLGSPPVSVRVGVGARVRVCVSA